MCAKKKSTKNIHEMHLTIYPEHVHFFSSLDSSSIKISDQAKIVFEEIIYKLIDWALHECFKR